MIGEISNELSNLNNLITCQYNWHISSFSWTESNFSLPVIEPRYHPWSQLEAMTRSTLASACIPCAFEFTIPCNSDSTSLIPHAIMNFAIKIFVHMFDNILMNLTRFNHEFTKSIHCKRNMMPNIHKAHKWTTPIPIQRCVYQIEI